MSSLLETIGLRIDAAYDRGIEVALHGTSRLVPEIGKVLAGLVVAVALVLDTAVVGFGVEPGEVAGLS